MSIDRRANAQVRRRRVLYQTSSDITTESAAERRAAEKLREARRPTASYGSHVNRRLRGRWFSLVPVRRRSTALCGAAILGSAMVLTGLHMAAVSWTPLASQPELARPLRLDRPDSIGTWAKTFFLAAAAATALLVYQLRRYKVDDYTGRYRIWRPVILLVAILSIDSVCDLVPWFGAMIDAVLGKRIALAGADWIRIALTVGGGALALQLIAEIRRSKLALSMMLFAVAGFMVPLLSRTHMINASALPGWIAVTSAPLIASAALWYSIGGYLRLLLREVRGLNELQPALLDKAGGEREAGKKQGDTDSAPRWSWFGRGRADKLAAAERETTTEPRSARRPMRTTTKEETKPKEASKASWFARSKKLAVTEAESAESPLKPLPQARESTARDTSQTESGAAKRRWFALRQKAEARSDEQPERKVASAVRPKTQPVEELPKTKRSWLSRLRSPAAVADVDSPTVAKTPGKPMEARGEAKPSGSPPAEVKAVRKGLGGWLRRDASPAAAASANGVQPVAKSVALRSTVDETEGDDEEIGDDSVDWESMNKSERRRMRKEIKRGGRAA